MSKYNKFWVAVLILGANTIRARYNIDIGLDDAMANDLVTGLAALLVYAVPNRSA